MRRKYGLGEQLSFLSVERFVQRALLQARECNSILGICAVKGTLKCSCMSACIQDTLYMNTAAFGSPSVSEDVGNGVASLPSRLHR